ncbi:transcription termination factor NusG, partial [Salmonella enterica]|nr:transcription termination factor NusG [Salmonella enterica]
FNTADTVFSDLPSPENSGAM